MDPRQTWIAERIFEGPVVEAKEEVSSRDAVKQRVTRLSHPKLVFAFRSSAERTAMQGTPGSWLAAKES